MWILPITRRELVDLITPRRGGNIPNVVEENRPSFDIVSPDVMAAVWPEPPAEFGRLPTAIVVPEGSQRDSLAWLSTYVRDFRPFTAYCRVVERPIAEQFLKGPPVPRLMGAEGICAGLILGEALTHAYGRASILDLPATAYSATLSHAISRTLALTNGTIPTDLVGQLWFQVREMTRHNGLGVPPAAIQAVWTVALGMPGVTTHQRTLFDQADVLAMAWGELNTVGEIREPTWRRLIDGYSDLDRMRALVEMPREQRLHIIDMALRLLATSRREADERRAFLAGYFTSLLAPGTLDHVEILAPVAQLLPTAYLWYGLFAGVNPRGDALPVGNSLARRIVRDLTIPDRLIDRPRCDVAMEELAMHGPSDNLLQLTAKAGRLDIDLLPGITTSVRWPLHDGAHEEELRRARDLEIQHLLTELEESTVRQRHLAERLRDALQMGNADRGQASRRKRGNRP